MSNISEPLVIKIPPEPYISFTLSGDIGPSSEVRERSRERGYGQADEIVTIHKESLNDYMWKLILRTTGRRRLKLVDHVASRWNHKWPPRIAEEILVCTFCGLNMNQIAPPVEGEE